MRAADDFEAIRDRLGDLGRPPPIDPATCVEHRFDKDAMRCVHCNIHFYHATAIVQGPTKIPRGAYRR